MDTVAQKKKNNKCYLSHTVNAEEGAVPMSADYGFPGSRDARVGAGFYCQKPAKGTENITLKIFISIGFQRRTGVAFSR